MSLIRFFARLYKKKCRGKFAQCSDDLRFSPQNSYFTYSSIEIGRNVFINRNAYFGGMVTIGNNVLFGPYVYITDGYHKYDEPGRFIEEQGGGKKERVYIDDDVWVGAKASIMRGVHLYEGVIIGTASVVTKDMPPYCICVGTPCIPIKCRYSDNALREHFKLMNRSAEEAEKMIRIRKELLGKYGKEDVLIG